jgi:hypothetical protein
MSILLFANIATTTLAGAITATATTANLAAGSGGLFPQPGSNQYFTMTLVDAGTGLIEEVVYVTAMSGDQVTAMTRAREGTAARAWNAGDKASNYWTAGNAAAMIQVGQLQQQATNFANDTGAVNNVTVSLSPVPGNLSAMNGSPIRIKVRLTNTGAATITLNGIGSAPLVTMGNVPLVAGQIVANTIIEVIYDTTAGVFWLQSAPPNVSSSAVGGVLTGNLPNPGFAPNPTFTGILTTTGTIYGALLETTPTGYLNIGTGPSNIGGTLVVDGAFTADGAATLGGALTVAGTLTANGDITLTGTMTAPGFILQNKNITLASGSLSAANVSATGTVYGAILATTATGSLGVGTGGATIGGNLVVGGIVTHAAPGGNLNASPVMNQFYGYLGGTGYKRIADQASPTGYMILQWGTVQTANNVEIAFPVAFPSICLGVVVSESAAGPSTWGAGNPTVHGVSGISTSGFAHWTLSWVGSGWTGGNNTCTWMAVGY